MVSVFSKIIAWEIPAHKVYEDERLYAFLDVRPFHSGHTLVVPKTEYAHFTDMPDDLWSYLHMTTKNIIAPAVKRATNCERIGLLVEWFGVPDHVHLHVIPLFKTGDMDPHSAHTEEPEAMKKMAEKIQNEIGNNK